MRAASAIGLGVALLVVPGCGDDDAPPAEAEAAPRAATETEGPSLAGSVAGVGWEAPEPFRPVAPSRPMRHAEYVFPEEGGEEPAILSVFFFGEGRGGSVEENIQRWVGQLRPEQEGDEPEVTEREVNGLEVTLVDAAGTYSAGTGPMGGGAPQRGQRMLGAIVAGPEGPVFFKMVGPRAVMDRAQHRFDQLVSSLH